MCTGPAAAVPARSIGGGSGVVGDDLPERTRGFVVRSRREEELVVQPVVRRVAAEGDRPQAVDGDPLAGAVPELAVVVPLLAVPAIRVDPAVAEVADEEIVAEPAEVGWRPGEPPRRVQPTVGRDPPEEGAICRERIDDTASVTGEL